MPIIVDDHRHVAALLDSGNVWRSAISKEFFLSLGYSLDDIRPLKTKTLGTAKEGSSLLVLGEPVRSLHFSLGTSRTKFKFLPIIVAGLSTDVNISGPFLKANKMDQLHSNDCLRVQGRNIKLTSSKKLESPESKLYVRGKRIAKANSLTMIDLAATEVEAGRMPAGDGVVRGDEHFMEKTDLHPLLNAIVTCDDKGRMRGAVLNTLATDIIIPDGQRYGTFTRTCREAEWEDSPWRVCEMKAEEEPATSAATVPPGKTDPPTRITRQSRHAEYVKQFVAKAKQQAKEPSSAAVDPTNFTTQEKRGWFVTQFKLDESPFLKDAASLKAAIDVLMEFWPLFSHDGSFGKTSIFKHRIITTEVAPIRNRYRPIAPDLEPDLRRQLDLWLKHDVIEKAHSPWSSNLVAAKKRGGKLRSV